MTTATTDPTPNLLDVHHHLVPPAYLDALRAAGRDTAGFPAWSPERSLAMMDRLGIGRALLSLSSPGVWLGDGAGARTLARACNEHAAEVVRRHPDRFGALAALPFPDVDGAAEEIAYALDTLRLDGVILLSSVDGRYVGDPEHDAILVELDRRGAVVLLHPGDLPADHEDAPLDAWIEYPIDVARAFVRLVLHDALSRYPGIRWVLAHAGGVVPFVADRLGKAHYVRGAKPRWGRILKDLLLKRNGGLDLARGVSYDTVGAASPATSAALRRLVPPEQIRYGSNFPFDPAPVGRGR
jgi:predicted TIM-barrel fold metal-dependent hydrolase